MAKQIFKVGDAVRLDGAGWDRYCSTPLAGKSFEVWSVEPDGRACIPILPAGGGGFYMGWASPDESDPLYGAVVVSSVEA